MREIRLLAEPVITDVKGGKDSFDTYGTVFSIFKFSFDKSEFASKEKLVDAIKFKQETLAANLPYVMQYLKDDFTRTLPIVAAEYGAQIRDVDHLCELTAGRIYEKNIAKSDFFTQELLNRFSADIPKDEKEKFISNKITEYFKDAFQNKEALAETLLSNHNFSVAEIDAASTKHAEYKQKVLDAISRDGIAPDLQSSIIDSGHTMIIYNKDKLATNENKRTLLTAEGVSMRYSPNILFHDNGLHIKTMVEEEFIHSAASYLRYPDANDDYQKAIKTDLNPENCLLMVFNGSMPRSIQYVSGRGVSIDVPEVTVDLYRMHGGSGDFMMDGYFPTTKPFIAEFKERIAEKARELNSPAPSSFIDMKDRKNLSPDIQLGQ